MFVVIALACNALGWIRLSEIRYRKNAAPRLEEKGRLVAIVVPTFMLSLSLAEALPRWSKMLIPKHRTSLRV